MWEARVMVGGVRYKCPTFICVESQPLLTSSKSIYKPYENNQGIINPRARVDGTTKELTK